MSREVKFIEARGYYEEKNQEDLKDLSSDKAATLRLILEGLGIKVSQDQDGSAKPSGVPSGHDTTRNTPHLVHEGGNIPESSNQEEGNSGST